MNKGSDVESGELNQSLAEHSFLAVVRNLLSRRRFHIVGFMLQLAAFTIIKSEFYVALLPLAGITFFVRPCWRSACFSMHAWLLFYKQIYFLWSVGWIGPFLVGYQKALTSFIIFIFSSGAWYSFGFDESPFMIFCFVLIRTSTALVQKFITPTQVHSQVFKLAAPCYLFGVPAYLVFGISRSIEIMALVFHLLVDDVRFSPVGKSIVRPLVEKSQKMSGKKNLLTAAAIVLAVFIPISHSWYYGRAYPVADVPYVMSRIDESLAQAKDWFYVGQVQGIPDSRSSDAASAQFDLRRNLEKIEASKTDESETQNIAEKKPEPLQQIDLTINKIENGVTQISNESLDGQVQELPDSIQLRDLEHVEVLAQLPPKSTEVPTSANVSKSAEGIDVDPNESTEAIWLFVPVFCLLIFFLCICLLHCLYIPMIVYHA